MSELISKEVRTLANAFKENHDYDNSKQRITFKDVEKVIKANSPEDWPDIKAMKASQEAMININAAHTLAVGELGQDLMKKDKNLQRVSAKTTVGYSSMDTRFDKHLEGTAMGKPWEKYGKAASSMIVGVGRKATPYKDVVAHLAETTEKMFK